ncbi:MAG: hypothetical protein B6D64_15035 [Bacteroidetes bacterium 4484_276]|nr:MAG: hypothetical protein B6D64_15035 [Bacteroidetes bacterium 4484_276]
MNRLPALFFVLLANIVFLAHAVIPHHHHDSEVCFESSHCQSHNEPHEHGPAEHSHNHDGENKATYCILNQVFVVPSNHVKQECKCLDCDYSHPQFDKPQAILTDNRLYGLLPKIFKKDQLLFFTSTYTYFADRCVGPRAPPPVV